MCKFQSGVGGFRAADSRMNVTSYRTLTLSDPEVSGRPENLHQPLCFMLSATRSRSDNC